MPGTIPGTEFFKKKQKYLWLHETYIFLGARQKGKIRECVIKQCSLRRDKWSSLSQQLVMVNFLFEKRLEGKKSITGGYLKGKCSGRRNIQIHLGKVLGRNTPGCPWKSTEAKAAETEWRRQGISQETAVEWSKAFAATVRTKWPWAEVTRPYSNLRVRREYRKQEGQRQIS